MSNEKVVFERILEQFSLSGHGVIQANGQFLVIGGMSNQFTERCAFESDQLKCYLQKPLLFSYYLYPELFVVAEDYCQV